MYFRPQQNLYAGIFSDYTKLNDDIFEDSAWW